MPTTTVNFTNLKISDLYYSVSFLITSFFFTVLSFGQVQCTEDVEIIEGATINMCEDALNPISGTSGFTGYNWSGPSSSSNQEITPSSSGEYILSATDGIGCVSKDTIQVIVNLTPTPSIISSEGNPICSATTGTTLSLDNTYSSYNWGGGNTNSTYFVTSANVYTVTVQDANGCSGQAQINISMNNFSLTMSNTSGCAWEGVLLQAEGGTNYVWSNGSTASYIVVSPADVTNYNVTITNGSCSQILSQTVSPLEIEPYEIDDTIYVGVGDAEFLPGPSGYSTYNWYPTDQIDSPNSQGVVFNGNTSQTLTLEATHSTGCIFTNEVTIIVVDPTIPDAFSPNGDSYNEFFVIPELSMYEARVKIWNRWGDVVLDEKPYENLWDGKCKTMFCAGNESLPEGTYFYFIDVHGVTFDGYLTLKR